MMRKNRHPRGIATLIAISLVALLAMAVLSLTSQFTTDVRRTRNEIADTQLRQLLLAGALAAQQEMDGTIDLPLDDAALTVTYSQDGTVAEIRSTWGKRRAKQTVRFDQHRIVDAQLQ